MDKVLAQARALTKSLGHRPPAPAPFVMLLSDSARGYPLPDGAVRGSRRRSGPRLPGLVLVERTFGAAPAHRGQRRTAASNPPKFLTTAAPRAAVQAGADGLHWPEKRLGLRRRSGIRFAVETASAHSGLALAKALAAGIEVVLVSTAFPSASPSARRPAGPLRLALLCRSFPRAHVIALGGITLATSKRLRRCGLAGVAYVSMTGRGELKRH